MRATDVGVEWDGLSKAPWVWTGGLFLGCKAFPDVPAVSLLGVDVRRRACCAFTNPERGDLPGCVHYPKTRV